MFSGFQVINVLTNKWTNVACYDIWRCTIMSKKLKYGNRSDGRVSKWLIQEFKR